MGKLLVKIGTWIQKKWCALLCLWNALLVKLTVSVDKCPNKLCKCKKGVDMGAGAENPVNMQGPK